MGKIRLPNYIQIDVQPHASSDLPSMNQPITHLASREDCCAAVQSGINLRTSQVNVHVRREVCGCAGVHLAECGSALPLRVAACWRPQVSLLVYEK